MNWKEGKHFDIWTVSHLLSGFVLGGWMINLGMDFLSASVAYLGIAILWEAFELYRDVREHSRNRVVDVLIGLAGYAGLFLVSKEGLIRMTWLMPLTAIYVSMGVYGYINYRRRKSGEENLA